MLCYRIADGRRSIFEGTGAFLHGGRWNSPGSRVIYAAQTDSGALLEVLVHAGFNRIPKNHVSVTITVPDEIENEVLTASDVPGWSDESLMHSRRFGDKWISEGRSVVLIVPSLVLQGRESNILLNPAHPDFARIQISAREPVVWDQRLFGQI